LSQKEVEFEEAVNRAVNNVFQFSVITGCNFHFRLCLWRQIQNINLMVEYKETEQVELTCRMCAALEF